MLVETRVPGAGHHLVDQIRRHPISSVEAEKEIDRGHGGRDLKTSLQGIEMKTGLLVEKKWFY